MCAHTLERNSRIGACIGKREPERCTMREEALLGTRGQRGSGSTCCRVRYRPAMKAHLPRHQLVCSFLRCGHAWGGKVAARWGGRGPEWARSLEPACARRCHPETAAHCSGHMLTAGKQTEWRVARAWQCAGGEPVGRGKGVGGDGGWHCGAHAHAHPVIGPCPITVGPAHLASSS